VRAKAAPPNPDPPGTPMSPIVCVLYRHWLTYYCNLRLNYNCFRLLECHIDFIGQASHLTGGVENSGDARLPEIVGNFFGEHDLQD